MSKPAKSKFPETGNGKDAPRVAPSVKPPVDSMRKFRQANPRVDYYPIPDAVAAIEWLRERNPKVTTRELIDSLVVEGQRSLSGNA